MHTSIDVLPPCGSSNHGVQSKAKRRIDASLHFIDGNHWRLAFVIQTGGARRQSSDRSALHQRLASTPCPPAGDGYGLIVRSPEPRNARFQKRLLRDGEQLVLAHRPRPAPGQMIIGALFVRPALHRGHSNPVAGTARFIIKSAIVSTSSSASPGRPGGSGTATSLATATTAWSSG